MTAALISYSGGFAGEEQAILNWPGQFNSSMPLPR
jgi:hypothetical protein